MDILDEWCQPVRNVVDDAGNDAFPVQVGKAAASRKIREPYTEKRKFRKRVES
jgi:hypothetical protein